MLTELYRGFMRVHILHHAEKEEVYGLQMAQELGRHGYTSISPGTIYPALHGLEQAGYLQAEERLAGGHWRKYYRITPVGRLVLAQIKAKLRELAGEVLEAGE